MNWQNPCGSASRALPVPEMTLPVSYTAQAFRRQTRLHGTN